MSCGLVPNGRERHVAGFGAVELRRLEGLHIVENVLASRVFNSSKLFSVSGIQGTSLWVKARAALGGEIAGELNLAGEWQHVRIEPGAEQRVGL